MRFINILGSIIFLAIGYMILIRGEIPNLTDRDFYEYSTFIVLAYLATQGFGLLFRRPGKQSGFYLDLIFSMLPLFIVYESYIRGISIEQSYSFFWKIYFTVVALDLIIFTPIAYRFAMLMDEYVIHD